MGLHLNRDPKLSRAGAAGRVSGEPNPDDSEYWFRTFVFPFWIYPVHWKGVRLLALGLTSSGLCALISLEVFRPESWGSYLFGALFFMIAAWTLGVALWRTER